MNESVSILITGDFYGGSRIEKLIISNEFDKIFNDFVPFIKASDLSITNLESPLVNNGKPIYKTGPALKAIPKTIKAIEYAGFNLLTLANNHIMDYGFSGLKETIELCTANNINTVGAGVNYIKASQTYYTSIKGFSIAVINVTENEWSTTFGDNPGAHPLSPVRNYYKIQEAKKIADYVIIIVHGGHEMYNLPSLRMKETYRFFVDAGADAVVGHHTHCFSGYEIYNGAPIMYGLGNFLFDSKTKKREGWHLGYAIKLKLYSETKPSFDIIPYKQCDSNPGIKVLNDSEKSLFMDEIKRINSIIQDDVQLEQNFREFINNELLLTYKAFIEPFDFQPLKILQKLRIIPSLLNRKKMRLYLNLIRCEAHRDVLINILNDDSNS